MREARSAERSAQACEAVQQLDATRGDGPVTEGGLSAVIIGDSYSQGQYLDQPLDDAWSTLVGDAEGWTTYVDALGGTGLSSGGPCGDDRYATRVADDLELIPDIVLVQGSVNDAARANSLGDDAAEVLELLESVQRVIIVGPVTPPTIDTSESEAILREAAEAAGREFVSVSDLDLPYLDDGVHLTPEGHKMLAAAVVDAIG